VRSSVFLCVIVVSLAACSSFMRSSCERGDKKVMNAAYEGSLDLLSACLARKDISDVEKRRAYYAKAYALSNLDREVEAANAYDAAFAIKPASQLDEFINAGLSYRYANRPVDALKMAEQVATIESGKYANSMMVQYHLGWSQQLLGNHEKAVEAFSNGIPYQTDFAYAYWRRALSYEQLGKLDLAKMDLSAAATMFLKPEPGKPVKKSLQLMHKEIQQTYVRLGLQVPEAVLEALK
jgi:tetratricopeptide (TPR) repeat protein